MTKKKVCVVVTARPSYSRIKTALLAIKSHPNLELQLVVAGSALLDRYGDASKVIEADGFTIIERVYNVLEGENPTIMSKTTGIALMELSTTFYNLKPDMVVSIADRFETIATSIAAAYQNIPLVHIQGGEVTGNIDEKVRHANTKLADLHLVASEDAYNRVLKMGEYKSSIINTGCPSIDLAKDILNEDSSQFNPFDCYHGVGKIKNWQDGYLVGLQHPVTTEFGKSREHIVHTLQAIKDLDIPTFWFWPNVDAGADGTSKGIRVFREEEKPDNIYFYKNMQPLDFLRLIKNAKCLVGNSSVGIRESSFLGVPVVNIGSRQSGRLRGKNVMDCGYDIAEIKNSIKQQLKHKSYESQHIYGNGMAGQKIAEELARFEGQSHKVITY